MRKPQLTIDQHEHREKTLEKLFVFIKSNIDKEATQIAIDMDRMNFLISSDSYTYAINAFWTYFKTKYQIDDIEEYYENKTEMMRDIYVRCLMPFNLELDIKYGTRGLNKESFLNIFKKLWLCIKDIVQRFYLSVISVGVFLLTVYLSFYNAEMGQQWLSNLFLGVSSGLLAALIIATANRHIKGIISSLENQEGYIRNEVSRYYDLQKKDLENIRSNQGGFLINIVNINNSLKQHLLLMSKFPRITTQEYI